MKSDLQGFDSDDLESKKAQLIDYNNDINDKFKTIKNSIKSLSDSWKGKASDAVIKNFYDRLQMSANNRYEEQNNVINLINTIDQGYSQTETENSNLSARFKD